MCSKRIIESEFKAKQVKEKLEHKFMTLFKYYWCAECKGWHTAHRVPREQMKRIMAKFGMEYTQ